MKRRPWLALWLSLLSTSAVAQSNFNMPPPAGVGVGGAQVVTACGSGTLNTTQPAFVVVDQTGKLCVNATVSATISGTISTSPVVVSPVSVTTSPIGVQLQNGIVVNDACSFSTKTISPFFLAVNTSVVIVPGTAAKRTYVCAINYGQAAQDNVSFIEGSNASCVGSQAVVNGSSTSVNGVPYAANGGMTYGVGIGTVMQTATAANNLCLLHSGTTSISGGLSFVQQ